ncbi:RBBP9/YdeN family alpha/beta hydrolase [Staphylococcus simulans]|uniref:RBBP9/YdeN family alpha/beta hydrolase n=1 Tax=Staphylococcus simulans TaxID=1286 RepID=UPI00399BD66E
MTNIVLIHAQGADAHSNWYEWLEQSLRLEGYHCDIVNIQHDLPVDMDEWLKQLNEQVEITKYETYFVTHGFGTLAGLKYLEQHPDVHIEGFFSIAGYGPDAEGIHTDLHVSDVTLDIEGLKPRIDYFYGLASKDDPNVPYEATEQLVQSFGGETKIVEEAGHFTTKDGYDTFLALKNNMIKRMAN